MRILWGRAYRNNLEMQRLRIEGSLAFLLCKAEGREDTFPRSMRVPSCVFGPSSITTSAGSYEAYLVVMIILCEEHSGGEIQVASKVFFIVSNLRNVQETGSCMKLPDFLPSRISLCSCGGEIKVAMVLTLRNSTCL